MYSRLLSHKILGGWLLAALIILPYYSIALARSTDQDQEILIEADSAAIDIKKGTSTYRGNVVVKQGSIYMRGDTMQVFFNSQDDIERIVLLGAPATYRQLPNDSDVYDQAESSQMEYYALDNYIILTDNVKITQAGLDIVSEYVKYDTIKNLAQIKGSAATENANNKEQEGRVRFTIKDKKLNRR